MRTTFIIPLLVLMAVLLPTQAQGQLQPISTKELRIGYVSQTTNYISLQAPAVTTNYTLLLPPTTGTNGQVLITNGSGALSWSTPLTAVSGTTNFIPKFTSATTLGNSNIDDDGTTIGIAQWASTQRNIIIGNTATNSTVRIRSGTGGIDIGATDIAQGSTISVGGGNNQYFVNVGVGSVTNGITQTINIGTGSTTGTKNITIGSNATNSATTLISGSGALNLNASINQPTNINTGTSTGAVSIGNTANTTTIGSIATTLKTSVGSNDRIVLANSSGTLDQASISSVIGNSGWALAGNSITDASTQFLGSTNAFPLVVRSNNVERMRVTSDGSIGIGTAAPTGRLDVTSTQASRPALVVTAAASQSANLINVRNSAGTSMFTVNSSGNVTIDNPLTGGSTTSIAFGNQGSGYGALLVKNATLGSQVFDFYFGRHGGQNVAQLRFWRDQATEVMRITGSGDVGIGTGSTNPSQRLHIRGGNVLIDTVSTGTAGQLQLRNPAGTFQTNIQSGEQTANITYTLPTTAPTAGQVLSSATDGTMSWTTGLTASTGWTTLGNTGTTNGGTLGSAPSVGGNFIGTTDARTLSLVTNNVIQMQISTAGVVSTQNDMNVNGVTVGRGSGGSIVNTALGVLALASDGGGFNYNTAIGNTALQLATAANNTAVGYAVLSKTTTGGNNTAIGSSAMVNNTTGARNVSVGNAAMNANTTGSLNTVVGSQALQTGTTGGSNVAVGAGALVSMSTGSNNTAIGMDAGALISGGTSLTSTSRSVLIGDSTRINANGDANSIVIGSQAVGIGSNTVVLGNSSIVTTALRGNVGIGTTAPAVQLHATNTAATTNAVVDVMRLDFQSSGTPAVGIGTGLEFATETAANNTEIGSIIESVTTNVGNGTEAFDLVFRTMAAGAAAGERLRIASNGDVTAAAFFETSDARLKDVIRRDGNVVYYKWKDKRDDKIHIGYLAQEVQKTHPDQVNTDANGMMSVHYIELLVEKIRQLEKRIEELEQQKK